MFTRTQIEKECGWGGSWSALNERIMMNCRCERNPHVNVRDSLVRRRHTSAVHRLGGLQWSHSHDVIRNLPYLHDVIITRHVISAPRPDQLLVNGGLIGLVAFRVWRAVIFWPLVARLVLVVVHLGALRAGAQREAALRGQWVRHAVHDGVEARGRHWRQRVLTGATSGRTKRASVVVLFLGHAQFHQFPEFLRPFGVVRAGPFDVGHSVENVLEVLVHKTHVVHVLQNHWDDLVL